MFKATISIFLFFLLFTTSHIDSIRLVVDALTASNSMAAYHDLDALVTDSNEDGEESEDKDDLTDNVDDFYVSENPFWVINSASASLFGTHTKFSFTDFSRELLFPPEHA